MYVWDGVVVAQEIAPERSSAWFFEPGTFRPMAKVENGKAYACVTDQVATPRELMTREGKLAWCAGFTAFGELDTLKAKETDCPIRFQGQWFDEESGLHYNFHRYYDPETGKYLSSDPIGLDGGTRSYGYVHNPVSWVDPFGLAGCALSDETPLYRTMKSDESGAFLEGAPEGSSNANTMGARTPMSVAGNKNPVFDITPVGPDQMVGPSYTGQQRLSTSLDALPTRPGQSLGQTSVGDLPDGLGAVNDHGQHVTIYPTQDMPFSSYQGLLNQVPWR